MPDPLFLYPAPGAGIVDSRPCFNAAGDKVVFMRENGQGASLWTVDVTTNGMGTPQRLFPPQAVSSTNEATRPDWSWVNGKIAFSGTHNGHSGLFILDANGTNPQHVKITDQQGNVVNGDKIQYPSWYHDAQHLAVTDYGLNRILKVDSASGVSHPLTDPDWIWTGQSSVNQQSSDEVCMAAQLRCCPAPKPSLGCRDCAPGATGYDQTKNHIWVQHAPSTDRPHCIQVEGHGHGRAPWWSPGGDCIAFESDYQNQATGKYAIYIYRRSNQSLTPVTPLDQWDCTHAKFHPTTHNRIVVAATQTGVRSGIAIVDFPVNVTAPL